MSARLIGRTGPTAGRDYVLTGVASIGAAPESEIRIVAPGVSRKHARIVVENDQYVLEDAGATNGTFLNGGRVTREALRHLDVITLGRAVDLIFIRRDTGNTGVSSDQITAARVQITDGAEAGTVVDVPKGELTFGRAPSCNVVLASGLISKVHARVQRTANQVVLQDLQSINGTFVNGDRVDSVQVLRNGDLINFAGVRNVAVVIEGPGGAVKATVTVAPIDEPAFNQEWKTRFVWAPDELAAIEAARAEAMQLAALRSAPAAEKKAAPAPLPRRTDGAKADGIAAPKPAAPAVKPPPAAPAPKPAQAALQQAETPVKPGSPVPVKKDPASATLPDAAPPATPAAAAAKAVQPATPAEASPKAAGPAAKAAPPAPVVPPKPAIAKAVVKPPAPPLEGPTIAPISDVEQTIITSPSTEPRVRGLKLVGAGRPIAVGVGTFVVGRAVGSDVRLDDRQVSRSHARLIVDDTAASVEDLQTVNGTLVNGKEVKARQPLRHGDTVQFGASEFTVELITS